MIGLAKGAQREVDDLALTRYACYLILTETWRISLFQGCEVHGKVKTLNGSLSNQLQK
jgi:hypothetical protein